MFTITFSYPLGIGLHIINTYSVVHQVRVTILKFQKLAEVGGGGGRGRGGERWEGDVGGESRSAHLSSKTSSL